MKMSLSMKWENRHTVLAVCCLSFASYHAARQVLLPAIPLVKQQMELSYAQTGFTASAYDLGYAASLILGGYLADRLKRTWFIFGGLLWLSFWLFMTTTAQGFVALAAFRILTGLAFGTYFSAGIGLISSFFSKEARGTALGIHMGFGAGGAKTITPLIAGLMIESVGWQPLFLLVVALGLVAALGFSRLVKEPPREIDRSLSFASLVGQVVASRTLIMLGLANAMTISSLVCLYTFMPLYLINDMGMGLAFAGYSIAMLNGVAIPPISLFGVLSDRWGRRPVILLISFVAAVSLLLFPYLRGDVQIVAGILLMGIFVGSAFSIIITYVVDLTPATHRSTATGYVNTFAVAGGAFAQIIAGYISDFFGVTYVFPFLALLSLIGVAIVWPVREPATGTIQMGASR